MVIKKRKYIIKNWTVLYILILCKVWLLIDFPVFAIGPAAVDDRLYINLASNIGNGLWLGPYDQFTLSKGMFFSFWLVINRLIGFQYIIGSFLFYSISILFLYKTLRHFVGDSLLLLIFIALVVYNPYIESINRVIREGIYPALVIFLIAFLLNLLRRKLSVQKQILYIFGAGLSLGCLWNTREEGVWILPMMIIFFIAIIYFRTRKTEFYSFTYFKTICLHLCIPLIACTITCSIAVLNYKHYGTFTTVDFKSSPYESAYASLNRVKNINITFRKIPVNKDTRKLIYEVSPSFKQLEELLEKPDFPYKGSSCQYYPESCGDYAGGWFMWAFRHAVQLKGLYKSAHSSEEYYTQLAREIDQACDADLLSCLPKKDNLVPHLSNEDLIQICKSVLSGYRHILKGFRNMVIQQNSVGDSASLQLFKSITNSSERQISTDYSPMNSLGPLKIKILQAIRNFYEKIIFPFSGLVTLLVPIILALCFFKKIGFSQKVLIISIIGIQGSLVGRLVILSIINVTSFPGISFIYMVPLYSVQLVLLVLTLLVFISILTEEQVLLNVRKYLKNFMSARFLAW